MERPTHTDSLDTPDPLVGTTIGQKYRIVEAIAQGGMGRVYRAQQLPLGRSVALKTMSLSDGSSADDPSGRRRFEAEAAACAELTHPNTVRIYDYGFDNDLCYIVMEHVVGLSLHRLVREQGTMVPRRAIHVGMQLCGSLAEAHQRGIIHRDLKPGNVLICTQGDDEDFVKVVDFGVAKTRTAELTEVGTILGSPHYMAPEQIRGEPVDGRADVYALGVLLFFAMTGRRPFEDRETSVAVLMAQLNDEIPQPSVNTRVLIPETLTWVIARCLERDRENRFASMRELHRALRLCYADAAGELRPASLSLSLVRGRLVLPADLAEQQTLDRSGFFPTGTGTGASPVAIPPPVVDPALLHAAAPVLRPPDVRAWAALAVLVGAFLALVFIGTAAVVLASWFAFVERQPPPAVILPPDAPFVVPPTFLPPPPVTVEEPAVDPALPQEVAPTVVPPPPPPSAMPSRPEPTATRPAAPAPALAPAPELAPAPVLAPAPAVEPVAPTRAPAPVPASEPWRVEDDVRDPFQR